MKQLTETLTRYLQALYGRDFPKDGICSHLGVRVRCGRDYIGITDYQGQDLLITVYASGRRVYSHSRHMKVKATVLRTVRQFHKEAKVATYWNGKEGHRGISIVIPGALPESIRVCSFINYHQISNVFNCTPEEKTQFKTFNKWLEDRLYQKRIKRARRQQTTVKRKK